MLTTNIFYKDYLFSPYMYTENIFKEKPNTLKCNYNDKYEKKI